MFRALGKSKIAFVLAILFGISLFFFRSSSRYSNFFNSDNVIATVSGTPISTTIFNRSMQMKIDQFSQFYDNELSKDAIKFFQMESLSGLINNAVFENEFEKNKFLIDETVVAKKTKSSLSLSLSIYIYIYIYIKPGNLPIRVRDIHIKLPVF